MTDAELIAWCKERATDARTEHRECGENAEAPGALHEGVREAMHTLAAAALADAEVFDAIAARLAEHETQGRRTDGWVRDHLSREGCLVFQESRDAVPVWEPATLIVYSSPPARAGQKEDE